jgi:hypothetical protein
MDYIKKRDLIIERVSKLAAIADHYEDIATFKLYNVKYTDKQLKDSVEQVDAVIKSIYRLLGWTF